MRLEKKFHDKVFWITGASSGIGKALCIRLAEYGAKLIISARNRKKLQQIAKDISESPGDAEILVLDLEDLDSISRKAEEALAFYGRIDYFISNAGVAIRDFVKNTDFKIDQKIMDVNYFGSILITKSLLPHFLESNSGHITVISSLSGKYGVPKLASYSASKHALHGFYESLRSETNTTNIKITLVIPGIIQTNITAHALTGSGETYGKIEKSFEKAYPVEKSANKIIRAIYCEKEEVFVGGMEGLTLKINRVSPWFLRRFIRNHPIKKLRNIKKMVGFIK